jgi:hypothetical protein
MAGRCCGRDHTERDAFKIAFECVDLTTVATRPTYRAFAALGAGSRWIVTVPELDVTAEARYFALVEPAIRDAIARKTGVAPRSFNLEVTDCDDTTRPFAVI